MNRLANTTSPYLAQHADNPVDWWPWCEEAFAEARRLDRPVLLSVGYSACHWCHVMAHESFEDPATAALMNEHLVSIKVDREERPDIDAIYMEAVQSMTGQGGWPMTVFLTPEGRPFYGGTYFPDTPRAGMPSFTQVIEALSGAWASRRQEVLDQADTLADAIAARTALPRAEGPGAPAADIVQRGYKAISSLHDNTWGGFGQAPKFPQTSMLDVLLGEIRRSGGASSPEALAMVTTTLDAMASGGIYDHLGGGFSRYSVDGRWLVPHFEKMLYDQAGLARSYLHAWQLTAEPRWMQVLDETISYVLAELGNPQGGLASAEDADSEGVEGRFYVWTQAQIREVLSPELAAAVIDWYGVTDHGNFEGSNILNRPVRGDLLRPAEVSEGRRALFEERARRVRPGLDDKALLEWNAMFCSTLADAASATGRQDWAQAAVGVAEFMVGHLRGADGRWMRSWRNGVVSHLAPAADHAWALDAFVRVYELTGRLRWLELAEQTANTMLELFWDPAEGGLFSTGDDAERLIVRTKDFFDGAVPAANSVAALGLLRVGALTGATEYGERARQILDLIAPLATQHPTAFSYAMGAFSLLAEGSTEVVIPGEHLELVQAARRSWRPAMVLAWGERGAGPLWEGRSDGAAHVCRNYACELPVSTPEELLAQLDR